MLSTVQQQNDFCLTSGQSSPDETQWVLFLQDKRRWTVTQAGVSADETRSGQRREKQKGPLRSLICSQPLSYWLKEQPGIKLTRKKYFVISWCSNPWWMLKGTWKGKKKKSSHLQQEKGNSVLKWTSREKSHNPYCINTFMCLKLDFTMMLLVLSAHSLCVTL